mgnify:CR=1 FL=1
MKTCEEIKKSGGRFSPQSESWSVPDLSGDSCNIIDISKYMLTNRLIRLKISDKARAVINRKILLKENIKLREDSDSSLKDIVESNKNALITQIGDFSELSARISKIVDGTVLIINDKTCGELVQMFGIDVVDTKDLKTFISKNKTKYDNIFIVGHETFKNCRTQKFKLLLNYIQKTKTRVFGITKLNFEEYPKEHFPMLKLINSEKFKTVSRFKSLFLTETYPNQYKLKSLNNFMYVFPGIIY